MADVPVGSMYGALAEKRLGDGRFVTVYPEALGSARLCVEDNERTRLHGERDGGYDRYYQYESVAAALAAFEIFSDGDAEPDGWVRAAPPRFRRRPGGDPAKEYVRE